VRVPVILGEQQVHAFLVGLRHDLGDSEAEPAQPGAHHHRDDLVELRVGERGPEIAQRAIELLGEARALRPTCAKVLPAL
jgi:hypothetical protein